MPKIILFVCAWLLASASAFAQDDNTPYQKNQELPQDVAFKIRDIYNANRHKIPAEQALKNMPLNTKLPANINETLYQYDWLEIGDYFFHPNGNSYDLNDVQFNLKRYHSTKGVLQFRYRLLFQGTQATLEFEDNDSNIPKQIAKQGTHFYWMDIPSANKDTAYYPVVDYKDGFLIIDITYSSAMNDFNNPRRFRKVYMAIPKFF